MRQLLTILTVLSIAAWSQPAQPQAQPLIVMQVQMPPTNPWLHLLELVVPGIIGAGLALFGVWLTNKNNAALEKIKSQTTVKQQKYEHLMDTIWQETMVLIECIDTALLLREPEGSLQTNLSRMKILAAHNILRSLTLASLYAPPDVYRAVMAHDALFYKCTWLLTQSNPPQMYLQDLATYKRNLQDSGTAIILAVRQDLGYDAIDLKSPLEALRAV
jgi:hypothetical protein